MEPLYLFGVASAQARWLALRQSAVAENIANANTPGYRGVEIAPFGDVYEATGLQMDVTNKRDIAPSFLDLVAAVKDGEAPWGVTYSGNSVSLDQEMLNANQINRAYSLNMAVTQAFAKMLSMSVKGPA